jgi:hypothetical protein
MVLSGWDVTSKSIRQNPVKIEALLLERAGAIEAVLLVAIEFRTCISKLSET